MADWSAITPTSPIKEIEAARKRVLDLREQISQRREQRDQAAAHVVELERSDRQRMADAMAAGQEAESDVDSIEKARASAAGAVRTTEALVLAIQGAEDQLHAAVVKSRGKWVDRAQRDVIEARAEAAATLTAFTAALSRYRDAVSVEGWLREDSGLDRGKPARVGLLGVAAGSASVTGNQQPVAVETVLAWLRETIDPPAPRPIPAPQPLQPIPS